MTGKINNLAGRLRRCMTAGLLNYSDLSRWFEVSRPSLVSWVEDARAPHSVRVPELDRRLKLLEAVIKRGHFPVPFNLSQRQRPTYIRDTYHAANTGGVSAPASR